MSKAPTPPPTAGADHNFNEPHYMEYWEHQPKFNALLLASLALLATGLFFNWVHDVQRDNERKRADISISNEANEAHSIAAKAQRDLAAKSSPSVQAPRWDHDRPGQDEPEARMAWNQKKIEALRATVTRDRELYERLVIDQSTTHKLKKQVDDNVLKPLRPVIGKPGDPDYDDGLDDGSFDMKPVVSPSTTEIYDPSKTTKDSLIKPSPPDTLVDPFPLDSPADEPAKNKVPSLPPR